MGKVNNLDWTETFKRAQPHKPNNTSSTKHTHHKVESREPETVAPHKKAGLILSASALLVTAPLLLANGFIDITTVFAETSNSNINYSEVITVADSTGWKLLIDKILWITDFLMDGIIIFSGISWMFGNRTKAIELLFGAGVGYIIVRHHEEIKTFFALL